MSVIQSFRLVLLWFIAHWESILLVVHGFERADWGASCLAEWDDQGQRDRSGQGN